MPQLVSDFGSNMEENIVRWAKKIRPESAKFKVLKALYSSKKIKWTIQEIAEHTGLVPKAASMAAKALHDLLTHDKEPGKPLSYSKRPDVVPEKDKLLRLIRSPKQIAKIATKRNPRPERSARPPNGFLTGRAIHKTIDDIDSFSRARRIDSNQVPTTLSPPRLPEEAFKKGIENILGERTRLKDWGGENLDIYSTKLVINKRRVRAGFALKGPAKTGRLTPRKMGANGDQIDRLLSQPIDVAIVQYEGDIDPSIYSLLEKLAREKARSEDRNIYYCLINLLDSYRLRMAYPRAFK
jgi:hypothetical protein